MILVLMSLLAGATEDAFEGVGMPPLDDPPATQAITDARTDALADILRCPVCQGMSVADSREDASLAMKERIREMVAAGYSDEQIIDYFVDRYGEGIVLLPDNRHWMIWLLPLLALAAGGGMIVLRMRPRRTPPTPPVTVPAEDDNDPYRAQILAELAED
ncbi:MAG: cytochrome c-type biogenesis protein CcmH [Myxococcota bacterium]|nr:cytochrome c-type biogenesis protein CcmH [Myxococcota bacterium]